MHSGDIGPFRLERELGRGGMGEVYLATDTRLDRQVAIKALPAHVAQDSDRLARFQREAKVLASLNHPGIGAIYGLEEANGHQYLILEFVEGETLADRLQRGAIPVDEALRLAKQIAEALEAAHEKGVIHRDLKPANVMVTPNGVAKVLDFGLARNDESGSRPPSSGSAFANSPTVTSPAGFAPSPTIPGVIMGTAGYMSPEQALGKAVDKRSDIFSFGCVLFEMLTGSMPFRGETAADAIGAMLHKETDFARLPANTPRLVRDLVASCLAKDRKSRLHDIGDARLALERAIAEPRDVIGIPGAPRARGFSASIVAAAALLAVAAIVVAWTLQPRTGAVDAARVSGKVVRATIELPDDLEYRSDVGSVTLSPDGTRVVIVAGPKGGASGHSLYVRDLSKQEFRELADTDEAMFPFWSPDSKSIAFFADKKLKRIDLDDEIVRILCDAPAGRGGSWGTRGTIAFAPSAVGGLSIVSDAGGTPKSLTTPTSPNESHRLPEYLPDGEHLLTYIKGDESGVYAFDPATQVTKLVLPGDSEAKFVAPGHLAFVRDGNLVIQPFDLARLELSGTPRPIASKLASHSTRHFINVGIAADGTLVYLPRERIALSRLAWLGRDGTQTPIVTEPTAFVGWFAALSPDGRRAVASVSGETGSETLRLFDLERGTYSPIGDTTWRIVNHPVWCGRAQRIVCTAVGDAGYGLWSIPLTGGGTPELLSSDPGLEYMPGSITPDERTLLFSQWNNRDKIGELMTLSLEPAANPVPLMATRTSEYVPRISPSGRVVSYVELGNSIANGTLVVISYPTPTTPVMVSKAGGAVSGLQHWLADDELAWSDQSRNIWSATVTLKDGELDVGLPQPLFGGKPLDERTSLAAYDRARERFLVFIEEAPPEQPSLVYVSDWRAGTDGAEAER